MRVEFVKLYNSDDSFNDNSDNDNSDNDNSDNDNSDNDNSDNDNSDNSNYIRPDHHPIGRMQFLYLRVGLVSVA